MYTGMRYLSLARLYWSFPQAWESESESSAPSPSISSVTRVDGEPSFAMTCSSLRYLAGNPRLRKTRPWAILASCQVGSSTRARLYSARARSREFLLSCSPPGRGGTPQPCDGRCRQLSGCRSPWFQARGGRSRRRGSPAVRWRSLQWLSTRPPTPCKPVPGRATRRHCPSRLQGLRAAPRPPRQVRRA